MNPWVRRCYLIALFSFLYLPIMLLILYSGNSAQYSLRWAGFTTQWYQTLLTDATLWWATVHSVVLGLSAATLASCVGTLAALALKQLRFSGKGAFYALIFMLILLPDIVLGIALLTFFQYAHVKAGFMTLLLGHTLFCLPFVVVTVYARLQMLDEHLFNAAQDLGASNTQIFWWITWPLLLPAIAASFLLSLTLSVDDVIVSYFLAGPDFEILPLKILGVLRVGVNSEVNALCTVIFFITVGLVGAMQWLRR